jgi:hypothetical protein
MIYGGHLSIDLKTEKSRKRQISVRLCAFLVRSSPGLDLVGSN